MAPALAFFLRDADVDVTYLFIQSVSDIDHNDITSAINKSLVLDCTYELNVSN